MSEEEAIVSTGSSSWQSRLDRAIREGFLFKGSQLLAVVAAAGIIALMAVTVMWVIGRYTPLAGGWLINSGDITELTLTVVICFGASYSWYTRSHIRVELVRNYLKWRSSLLATVDALTAFLFAIYAAVIVWAVCERAIIAVTRGDVSHIAEIPVAPFMIAFVVMMAHFVLAILGSCFGLVIKATRRPVEHEGLY